MRFTESGGLKDLDLDYQAAADLAKAVGLLDTTAAFGRPSVGVGHLLYNAPGTKAKKFELPEGSYPKPLPLHDGKPSLLVLEIRGADNTYTMFPPSVHPDTGETLGWIGAQSRAYGYGRPASSDCSPVDTHSPRWCCSSIRKMRRPVMKRAWH